MNKTSDAQDSEKNYLKFFKLKLLDTSKWHPNNDIQNIANN